jgi:hypothetical protein
MKRLFGAALLALLLAGPAQAGLLPPFKIECGCNCYLRVTCNPYGTTLGPWYTYWPLDAQFQTPANPHYPYWPAPQIPPPGVPLGSAPVPPAPAPAQPPVTQPPLNAGPAAPPPTTPPPVNTQPDAGLEPAGYPTSLQPVGYQGQMPAYWYGR